MMEEKILEENGIRISILLQADGQEPPRKGNRVVVRGELRLPQSSTYSYLEPELRFEVPILEAPLSEVWGFTRRGEDWRIQTIVAKATTWKKAKERAFARLSCEAEKIFALVEERKQALKNAGPWE